MCAKMFVENSGLLNEVKFLRSLARSVEEGGWFNGGTRGDWIDLLSNA